MSASSPSALLLGRVSTAAQPAMLCSLDGLVSGEGQRAQGQGQGLPRQRPPFLTAPVYSAHLCVVANFSALNGDNEGVRHPGARPEGNSAWEVCPWSVAPSVRSEPWLFRWSVSFPLERVTLGGLCFLDWYAEGEGSWAVITLRLNKSGIHV